MSILNFSIKNLFFLNFLKIVSKYFVNDCLRKQTSLLNSVQIPWNINFLEISKSFDMFKIDIQSNWYMTYS